MENKEKLLVVTVIVFPFFNFTCSFPHEYLIQMHVICDVLQKKRTESWKTKTM